MSDDGLAQKGHGKGTPTEVLRMIPGMHVRGVTHHRIGGYHRIDRQSQLQTTLARTSPMEPIGTRIVNCDP